jgi:hypothetical protein
VNWIFFNSAYVPPRKKIVVPAVARSTADWIDLNGEVIVPDPPSEPSTATKITFSVGNIDAVIVDLVVVALETPGVVDLVVVRDVVTAVVNSVVVVIAAEP